MIKDIESGLIKPLILLAFCRYRYHTSLFESPGFSGVPDRIILLPGAKVIFVEMKKPGKTERKRQLYVQGLLRALGFEVFSAVDSVEKIEAVLARCREVLRDEGILPA